MAASAPSSITFATHLGLTQGLDAPPARIIAQSPSMPAAIMLMQVSGWEYQRRNVFLEQVAALYLPCLLRTYINGRYPDMNTLSVYTMIVRLCTRMASAGRFVYLYPTEGSCVLLGAITVSTTLREEVLYQRDEVDKLLLSATNLIATLAVHVLYKHSEVGDSYRLDPDLKVGLRRILDRLDPAMFDNPQELDILSKLSDPSIDDIIVSHATQRQGGPCPAWWTCEVRVGIVPPAGRLVCVEDGAEMQACGGCLSVRYCSRAHQKLDWKLHKQLCFKPSW